MSLVTLFRRFDFQSLLSSSYFYLLSLFSGLKGVILISPGCNFVPRFIFLSSLFLLTTII